MSSAHFKKSDVTRSVGVAGFSALVVVVAAVWASTVTAAPPAQGEFGTIKGRLVWGGADLPVPKTLPINKDQEICGNMPVVSKALLVDPTTKGVGNAFAYLLTPSGSNPEAEKELLARAAEVVIDQKKCEYIPYSTVLHQNQSLVFKSSDATNHNVHYTAITNNAFNQILPPNGQVKVKLVAERNPIPLTCDLHDWMKGAIMVFNHPFFSVTKDDGTFEIHGVPPGEQKLIVRLASGLYMIPGATHATTVKVEAGKTTDVEVKIDPSLIR